MKLKDIKTQKQLNLYVVSQQRELLKFLANEITESYNEGDVIYDGNLFIEEALKNFNCG